MDCWTQGDNGQGTPKGAEQPQPAGHHGHRNQGHGGCHCARTQHVCLYGPVCRHGQRCHQGLSCLGHEAEGGPCSNITGEKVAKVANTFKEMSSDKVIAFQCQKVNVPRHSLLSPQIPSGGKGRLEAPDFRWAWNPSASSALVSRPLQNRITYT